MPLTQKQRDLRRRQRRVKKLRQLKTDLIAAQDSASRERILRKIRKLSPWDPILSQ